MTAKNPSQKHIAEDRPYSRTITLTVSNRTYKKLAGLKPGKTMEIQFVNDIVSSAKGGSSRRMKPDGSIEWVHHSLRRSSLLRRAIKGGYTRVKVRSSMDNGIYCSLIGSIGGWVDDCVNMVFVCRA